MSSEKQYRDNKQQILRLFSSQAACKNKPHDMSSLICEWMTLSDSFNESQIWNSLINILYNQQTQILMSWHHVHYTSYSANTKDLDSFKERVKENETVLRYQTAINISE